MLKSNTALTQSQKIGSESKKDKFDWHSVHDVVLKVEEELLELKEEISSGDKKRQELELGDLLFSVAQLSRHLNIDSEKALLNANAKFEKRFSTMMELCKSKQLNWSEITDAEKNNLWVEVKKHEKFIS